MKIIFEGFKDIWRNGQYTLSTDVGYITFPKKADAIHYLRYIKLYASFREVLA